MARFRLLHAHYFPGDKLLLGDFEQEQFGKQGEVVGDGTDHPLYWPTIFMEPLDDEAREMLAKERKRMKDNEGVIDPVEELELEYLPGSNVRRREPRPHGASVRDE